MLPVEAGWLPCHRHPHRDNQSLERQTQESGRRPLFILYCDGSEASCWNFQVVRRRHPNLQTPHLNPIGAKDVLLELRTYIKIYSTIIGSEW